MNRPAPLQSVSPNLYRQITMKLEDEYHIHPYDIQIFGTENEGGIHVTVSYGSQFSHQADQFFTHQELDDGNSKIDSFIEKTGKQCREVMIDDYFKKMTP